MIGLKISGRDAEMNPGTSISMKLVNPIFNDDNLSPGSFSMPFELPGGEVSPVNAAVFKNPDVIENSEGFVKQDADLFFDGDLFKKGKIRVKSFSPNRLTAHFTFGLSTISDEFKTKKLRELLDEEIVIDNSVVTKKIYLKPNPEFVLLGGSGATKPFPIIVNGKTYEADTIEQLRDAINANTDEPRAIAILRTEGVSSGGLVAPYLELQSSASTTDPLTDLSVDIDTNLVYADSQNKLKYEVHGEMDDVNNNGYYDPFWTFLQGYFTGAYPDDKLRFPAVFNALSLYNGVMMDGGSPTLIRNLVAPGNVFSVQNRNSIHPFVRVKWVLEQIASYFGFQFDGDFYNSADLNEMLIWNPNNLDEAKPYIGKVPFVFWKRSFNISDLVPDMTVVDFLRALQSRYNLAVFFSEKTSKVFMSIRENIVKALMYNDITSKGSNFQDGDDLSLSGVKLAAKREEDDQAAGDDSFDIGTPEKTFPTDLSSIQSFTTRATPGGNVQAPFVIHPKASDFEFRVFYYKGLFDNGTVSYPKAHIHAVNFNDRFDDTNLGTGIGTSLYEYFWKRWIAYTLRRKSVKLDIDFPLGELLDIDWELKRRFDRNNYLIKSLDFSFTPTRLTVCNAELYTMR